MGRTDEGAKRPVTRSLRLLVVWCGDSSNSTHSLWWQTVGKP